MLPAQPVALAVSFAAAGGGGGGLGFFLFFSLLKSLRTSSSSASTSADLSTGSCSGRSFPCFATSPSSHFS